MTRKVHLIDLRGTLKPHMGACRKSGLGDVGWCASVKRVGEHMKKRGDWRHEEVREGRVIVGVIDDKGKKSTILPHAIMLCIHCLCVGQVV